MARTVSVIVVGLALAMTFLLPTTAAYGYWKGTGVGVGSGTTGSLQPPTNVQVPSASGGTVNVSWTASAGMLAPTGYFVTKTNGSTVAPACGSGPSTLLVTASCLDTVTTDGTYTYLITARYHSWTASSDASGAVTVAIATHLAFTVNPTTSVSRVAITPSVQVTIESASGSAVQTSGVPITLAMGNNPAAGTLNGTATASSDAMGVATFAGLSIDAVATGYTLAATSPGLASATSTAFAILTPPLAGPSLGTAATYSVLGTAATNGGVSTISGDLGTYPAVTAAGFPAGTVEGATHTGDATAALAESDLTAAYADAVGRTADTQFAGDVIGLTFTPGVHHTGAAFALSAGGVLTLDAQGNPNAVFIFQINGALDTAASSSIKLINGAQAANVYWQVNGAAGTGASSSFSGTILAAGAITLGAGSELIGRALSSGAVTLADNSIRFTATTAS
jgi:Ice-binding-like